MTRNLSISSIKKQKAIERLRELLEKKRLLKTFPQLLIKLHLHTQLNRFNFHKKYELKGFYLKSTVNAYTLLSLNSAFISLGLSMILSHIYLSLPYLSKLNIILFLGLLVTYI